ncbi:MAG: hypothetical protein ACJAYC_001674, partial [Halieaceae bacterium]
RVSAAARFAVFPEIKIELCAGLLRYVGPVARNSFLLFHGHGFIAVGRQSPHHINYRQCGGEFCSKLVPGFTIAPTPTAHGVVYVVEDRVMRLGVRH